MSRKTFVSAACRASAVSAAFAAVIALGGCSGYDVELQGGVFDALGVSGNVNGKKSKEPKLANRPGIVVPPSTASLPQPGGRPPVVVASNGEAFPVNPEEARKLKADARIRKHAEFCEKARERHEAGLTSVLESSPWGACHASALRALTGKDAGDIVSGIRAPEDEKHPQ